MDNTAETTPATAADENARAADERMIVFRCPAELAAVLPRPVPAVQGLPGWYKDMPLRAFSQILNSEQLTVKKCPPFIDAMTFGFLIPLMTDIHVQDGLFTWDHAVPVGSSPGAAHSPVDFHDNSQVTGSPFFDDDQIIVKFNSFWMMQSPPGYSLLITHPLNRPELPFTTLSGLVDADCYRDNFINFPARWNDPDFNGVLPKGTPIAQILPIKRDEWGARFDTIDDETTVRLYELKSLLANEHDVYRHRFRAAKR